MRNPHHDVLFEPVRIGPLTTRNRFFQVPHCNGGGYRDPSAVAAMREVKAEGGWGVVFTEQCEVTASSEITPFVELRLWDDQDVPALARMAESIKKHGALAGIQFAHSGINGPNLYTREVPVSPTGLPVRTDFDDPVNARTMDLEDIRRTRRAFANAARRAKTAGFDLICLYGAHGYGLFQHFLSRATNQRSDEYGGSLANRSRFIREVVADIREVVGDQMAISLRLSLDEQLGEQGFSNAELREFIAMHHDLPDLWDLARGVWEDCSASSRFKGEAAHEDLVRGIRELTGKPVVGVGRFTSPDAMVRQVKAGTLDLIGCARPSIADPFLPRKINEGRSDDIRECIGCNICITGDMMTAISRCTQNPTFMEEWRKGWHPERINPKGESSAVLVVGSGPAGLEAAWALCQRGYDVTVAEARAEIGGRVTRERRLPGLSEWGRVVDYRAYQLKQRPNVEIYRQSDLDAEAVLQFGVEHVAVATGSCWRRDGVARQHLTPIKASANARVFTPDDLMDGALPTGRVVLFDDDHYYMGGVLAELLVASGARVTLVTPGAYVSSWTRYTLEQRSIHKRLVGCGVHIMLNRGVVEIGDDAVVTNCVYGGGAEVLPADAVVIVGSRQGQDQLWHDLAARKSDWADAGIKSVMVIGDAEAPGPIAWATYAGHRYARELDAPARGDAVPFRREIAALSSH